MGTTTTTTTKSTVPLSRPNPRIDSATFARTLRKPPEQCRSVQSLRIHSFEQYFSRDRAHTICRLKAVIASTEKYRWAYKGAFRKCSASHSSSGTFDRNSF